MAQMPGNGDDNAADSVNQQVAAQQAARIQRPVLHAPQRQRNQRDDDQRVENHGGEHGALRRMQAHDVELSRTG